MFTDQKGCFLQDFGRLSLTGAAIVVALVAGTITMIAGAASRQASAGTKASAMFVRAADFRALVQDSAFVARARVQSVTTGPDIRIEDPDDPLLVPTEVVTFEAIETLDGEPPAVFSILRTGSAKFEIENEPPYAEGRVYVMAVRGPEGAEGWYVPTGGPDGRYAVQTDGKLRGVADSGVSKQVHGRSLGELKRMIRDARN